MIFPFVASILAVIPLLIPMSRRSRPITLSLQPGEKEMLEALALEFDCMWGESPNISELIGQIAVGNISLSWSNSSPSSLNDAQRKSINSSISLIQEGLSNLLRIL